MRNVEGFRVHEVLYADTKKEIRDPSVEIHLVKGFVTLISYHHCPVSHKSLREIMTNSADRSFDGFFNCLSCVMELKSCKTEQKSP
ncbi:hypothetical protein Bpfe_011760 [Biomphalaria pfeifferi]|uniref:Uncharacterized protein n=1 Tax=Biomphalaria pfeifferi TaxID=112525 RepID=A0AAD8BQC9_BIOPF|nr:hypothetical protein Bpfe_011760 [Biomphalaria pfeifferi]